MVPALTYEVIEVVEHVVIIHVPLPVTKALVRLGKLYALGKTQQTDHTN